MRIRRKPWARPELEACKYFIDNPKEMKNNWRKCFNNENPIHVELGCGKGVFLSDLAIKDLNTNFIAIDIKSDVLGYARRNVENFFGKTGPYSYNILIWNRKGTWEIV